MRVRCATLVLVSFAAIAVFGIVAMHQDGSEHGGCIGAEVMNGSCPPSGAMVFVSFHLRAFLWFSTAAFVSLAVTLLAALFAREWARKEPTRAFDAFRDLGQRARSREVIVPESRSALREFLTLFERRDPAPVHVPLS